MGESHQALGSLVTLPSYVAILQASPVINASTTPSVCLASATSKPGSVSTTALAVPVPPTSRTRTFTQLTHSCYRRRLRSRLAVFERELLQLCVYRYMSPQCGGLPDPILSLTTCFPLQQRLSSGTQATAAIVGGWHSWNKPVQGRSCGLVTSSACPTQPFVVDFPRRARVAIDSLFASATSGGSRR